MKNPWIRTQDLANMLGLSLGAMGTILIGLEFNNIYITVFGIISFIFFLVLFSITLGLLIDDYRKLLPNLKRKFLGIIPY